MEDPVYLADELVLSRMLTSEARQEIGSYFDNRLQRDFNENDRRELAIWMRDVCKAEECQPDIFPLSMMIVDRFLSFVRTKRTQLQLLGSVALLLASKLRQTSQIPAQHLVYYTQDLISLRELWDWELLVLTTLKWDLALITPVDYLDILTKRLKLVDDQIISDIEEEAQQMIVECCLEFRYSLYPPSIIAWACLMRAMETWKLGPEHLHLAPNTWLGRTDHLMIDPRLSVTADEVAEPELVSPCADKIPNQGYISYDHHHHHHHNHHQQHQHHLHHHEASLGSVGIGDQYY